MERTFTMKPIQLLCLLIMFFGNSHSGLSPITGKRGKNVQIVCPSGAGFNEKNLTTFEWKYKKSGSPDTEKPVITYNFKTFEFKVWPPYIRETVKFDSKTQNYTLEIEELEMANTGDYTCKGYTDLTNNGTLEKTLLFSDTTPVVIIDRPGAPPKPPELSEVNATSITVRWWPSEEDNNSPITNYIIILIKPKEKTEKSYSATMEQNPLTLVDLDPFTEYQAQVEAQNLVGSSDRSELSETVTTGEAAPTGKPRILNITYYPDALLIHFKRPPAVQLQGVPLGYNVDYEAIENGKKMEKVLPANATYTNLTDLEPYTSYRIHMALFNSEGSGPVLKIVVRTEEGVPSPPTLYNVVTAGTTLTLEWDKPQQPNGVLQGYVVYWKKDGSSHWEREPIYLSDKTEQDMLTHTISNLSPWTRYNFKVAGRTKGGQGQNSSVESQYTDVTGPSAPLNVTLTYNDSIGVIVTWVRPSLVYRQIDRYVLRYRSGSIDTVITIEDPDVNTLEESVISNILPEAYSIQLAGETKSLFTETYFTGTYSHVENVTVQADNKVDPLDPGEDNNTYFIAVIAGVVCCAAVLFALVVVSLLFRRYLKARYQFMADPESTTRLTSTTVALPESYNEADHSSIPVNQFAEHVHRYHADGDLLFSQEYDDINQGTRVDFPAKASADPESKLKNRYTNIVAYDHCRVLLNPRAGKTKSDYINANYVDGYHKAKAYIAAQGPLPTTFADFWWMVWEENSSAIVMITNLTERGRRKCDQYWPSDGEHQYEQMSVKLLDTYVTAYYTIRVFNLKNLKLKKKSGERIIKQFHYTSWPDHGVPDYTLPALTFIKKSTACTTETSGPPIVHCSAGVGRTGTYMVIDSMMRQIEEKDSVSILGFLSHIRNQRNYLVQTEDQYIFIHDALLEFIRSGDTEIPDGNLSTYIDELYVEDDDGLNLLQKQYALVTSFQPKDYQMQAALLPVNLTKNRSKTLLPIDATRVRLPVRPAVEGSDFINATYLQGYHKMKEYIVTQHPLESTVEDFWRMVWDQNSMAIVLLCEPEEKDLVQFWPEKDTTRDCGHFKVTFIEEVENDNYVSRDFLLQSTQDDYECTTRLISTSKWPESCSPLSATFDLIQTVRHWHQQCDEVEGPIIVVDRFGGPEAGTFCALSTLYAQLRHGGSVDVYMTCKLYSLQRPGIFPKEEDYNFLYKVLYSICDDSAFLGEKDSGISNCNNYPTTPPTHLSLIRKSTRRHSSSKDRQETTM